MSDCDVEKMENMMSQPFLTDADIIEKLEAENKALKERDWEECCEEVKAELRKALDVQIEANCSIANKLVECEQSRDELLSALKVAADENEGYVFNDTIQRAEALKGESKYTIIKLEAENKALKKELERKDKVYIQAIKSRQEWRKSFRRQLEKVVVLSKSRNELLKELNEVESTGFLPDGDSVNLSTKMWLERLIQKKPKP